MSDGGRVRTSSKQAIVILFEPVKQEWAAPIEVPLALDVIAAMAAVNGASLYATSPSTKLASPLVRFVPMGVSYTVPPERAHLSVAAWWGKELAQRRFERFLFVRADAIGVSPRLLATALSVLDSEESVVGLTPNEVPYLLGLRESALKIRPKRVRPLLDAFSSGRVHSPTGVSVESRSRLNELESLQEFHSVAGAFPDDLSRSMVAARI